MEFQITHKDESGREKTEFVTGSTAELVTKQYAALGIEVIKIQPVAEGTGARRENDVTVNPMAIKLPPGSTGMPEMDKLRNLPPEQIPGEPSPSMSPMQTQTANAPVWKEFEAAGIKFRMNLLTQELQEYTWADSEDDSILDDIGIAMEDDADGNPTTMTLREVLEHSEITSSGFIRKTWKKKEGEQ